MLLLQAAARCQPRRSVIAAATATRSSRIPELQPMRQRRSRQLHWPGCVSSPATRLCDAVCPLVCQQLLRRLCPPERVRRCRCRGHPYHLSFDTADKRLFLREHGHDLFLRQLPQYGSHAGRLCRRQMDSPDRGLQHGELHLSHVPLRTDVPGDRRRLGWGSMCDNACGQGPVTPECGTTSGGCVVNATLTSGVEITCNTCPQGGCP